MKYMRLPYIGIITAIIMLFVMPRPALHAATTVREASPTATVVPVKITPNTILDDLKARLATKVAELRTTVKRAMTGVVKTVSLTSATVETKTKDIKIELTDDMTVSQIIGGKRTRLELSDIEVSDPVTVFGSYDETLDLLKAQHIFIESATKTQRVSGLVTAVDTDTYVITIQSRDGKTVSADFEKLTKTTVWSKEAGLSKGGFSKITVGDTVHITGKPDPKNANSISALRILDIGNVTGTQPKPLVPTDTVEPSTPSATAKPTPKPTLKPTIKLPATPTPTP